MEKPFKTIKRPEKANYKPILIDGGAVKLKKKKLAILSRYRIQAAVFACYVALTIIFTYPVAFSVNTFPGDGGDGYWFLWDFWAFKNAIIAHTNPLYTSWIYYPIGVNLAFSTTSFFNAALSIPLQLIWDLPHAYVFVWLMSFALSGYGAFALMRYLGGSTKVAFISGLIFMLCPYHLAHALGHMNLIATAWIPLYALFFLRTIRESKRSNPAIAALFLSITAFCDFYYAIYLLAFSILAIAYYFWTERQQASFAGILRRTGITGVIFVGLTLPLLFPMFQELLHGGGYAYIGGFSQYSADLVAFVVPSRLHPLFGSEVAPLYQHLSGNVAEGTVFLGYVGIVLSALAIIKQRTREVRFWALAMGIFLMLSLGPVLQVAGAVVRVPSAVPYIGNAAVPLLYYVLMHLPVFSVARVASRWDIMVMLCVSVLSGYGLQYLVNLSHPSGRRVRNENVLCLVFAGLILFEFFSVPYPTATTAVPAFYQKLGTDSQDYAVFEVAPRSTAQIMYYQTIHHKQLVNGYVSREPPGSLHFIETEPVVRLLYHIQETQPGTVAVNTTSLDPSVLSRYNIKYVIVHRENLSQQQINLVQALFGKASKGAPVVYEEGPMVVYVLNE
ncbi:MAG: hypothetical protein ACXV5C_11750 [Halobacteriota archaeon]